MRRISFSHARKFSKSRYYNETVYDRLKNAFGGGSVKGWRFKGLYSPTNAVYRKRS